jgi:hypothetical protein
MLRAKLMPSAGVVGHRVVAVALLDVPGPYRRVA